MPLSRVTGLQRDPEKATKKKRGTIILFFLADA